MVDFYFSEWPDGETCERCAAEIHSGWIIDGHTYGPTCGKIIFRERGISFPENYGPGSFDYTAMMLAVELNRREWDSKGKQSRWVHTYEERKAHQKIVGKMGWKIAQAVAANSTLCLNTGDAVRCYEAAIGKMDIEPPRLALWENKVHDDRTYKPLRSTDDQV